MQALLSYLADSVIQTKPTATTSVKLDSYCFGLKGRTGSIMNGVRRGTKIQYLYWSMYYGIRFLTCDGISMALSYSRRAAFEDWY